MAAVRATPFGQVVVSAISQSGWFVSGPGRDTPRINRKKTS